MSDKRYGWGIFSPRGKLVDVILTTKYKARENMRDWCNHYEGGVRDQLPTVRECLDAGWRVKQAAITFW